MPMGRLWSDPERAQFHIQRAADWANNRAGYAPFGLGVMHMRRRESLSGFSAAGPLAAQANKPYRIWYLSLRAAQIPARFPTIRLPNSKLSGFQIRTVCQPQDRESARAHRAGDAASRRRQGDRMKRREFMVM